MQVKAQGLFNAAKWIEAQYGQAALRDVLRACSPEVRERYTTAIVINWHPIEEFIEFLEVAERMIGKNDGKLSEQVGAAGARENLRGAMTRAALYITNPEFFMKRVATLWSQFNDEGSMEIITFEPERFELEVKGVKKSHPLFCCTLTGWMTAVGDSFGWKSAHTEHLRCKGRGDTRCLWEVRGIVPSGPERPKPKR